MRNLTGSAKASERHPRSKWRYGAQSVEFAELGVVRLRKGAWAVSLSLEGQGVKEERKRKKETKKGFQLNGLV